MEACGRHAGYRGLPLMRLGKVEHQQVLFARNGVGGVSGPASEFQVVSGARHAEYHAVEAVMADERVEAVQANCGYVEARDRIKAISRARNAKMGLRVHRKQIGL